MRDPRPEGRSVMRQWLFDAFVSGRPGNGRVGRLAERALKSAYRVAGEVLGGEVDYRYQGMTLRMMLKHQFPLLEKYEPEHSKSIGRVAALVGAKYPDSVFFDIGANIGDTAAIMRTGAPNPIYAIEGVDAFYRLLERNAVAIGGVHPVKCFLSYDSGGRDVLLKVMETGNAVVYEKPELFGTDTAGSTSERIETTTLQALAERLAIAKPVKFVKTDIEGLDMPVLNAALGFIAREKPVLYFECHISDAFDRTYGITFLDFIARLREAGYRSMLYWDLSREFQHALNLADAAQLDDFVAIYRNRNGLKYADVCVLHADDADLAQSIREGERRHFVSQRPTDWWQR